MRGEASDEQLARKSRKCSLEAEKKLWFFLRDRRLAGRKFRRQYAIGPFMVDFVCLEKRLVIEVDGGQHSGMIVEDKRRTEFLHKHGYAVLRFWNNGVLEEIESVLQIILAHLTDG